MNQTALYREYHKPIYHTCLRILRSPMDAEECMQDAFMKLFTEGKMRFINNKACYAWLRRVAVRGAIDRLRSLDYQCFKEAETLSSKVMENIVAPQDPDLFRFMGEESDRETLVHIIKEQMDALPSGYRAILSLYLFEGYDFDEIAQITGLQPVSVRSQYSRGRKKLQSAINKIWMN
ncbi:MAG: sigma-70 family RNA polymerase sigma factor [Bacteroidales bacterium]|nr:sigma-70 family RNA polymerase sigma factor [Bacteroidales bacterium]MDD3522107.1 sigma-70 family RNA polymerase sigma factor [Bacteroidales bacterium]MDD4030146.1 sigma-70 family RNA polymerase sigma factor [Bacteroidales bacterium]MDD4435515.1 sigma-70 family RNA polymerase sigma factor [Bacteroidales bacterium]MDD5733520.1 sigma-70 family RNA polymerase sigma factor [Bacteroidales bacterium]